MSIAYSLKFIELEILPEQQMPSQGDSELKLDNSDIMSKFKGINMLCLTVMETDKSKVACYLRKKINYSIKPITTCENEAFFLNISFPKRKTKPSRFLRDLNDSVLKLQTFDSEIKVLDNFNTNLFLDVRYIIDKSLLI